MPFYKKKPVVVEARFFESYLRAPELSTWCGGEIDSTGFNRVAIRIHTPEGMMLAKVGDYIIKGVAGEFYPCKASTFHETYEESGEHPAS